MPGHQRAARNHRLAADLAVMRDMSGSHDVVVIADFRHRLGRRSARDGVVLTNLIAVADAQVASFPGEAFIQWIGAQYSASGDFVALAQNTPALDINVRLEHAAGSDPHVRFDDAELADVDA